MESKIDALEVNIESIEGELAQSKRMLAEKSQNEANLKAQIKAKEELIQVEKSIFMDLKNSFGLTKADADYDGLMS